jgi:hypothetical protein
MHRLFSFPGGVVAVLEPTAGPAKKPKKENFFP